MSKGKKIAIIVLLLLLAVVAVFFLTRSTPAEATAAQGTGTESNPLNWQIIPGTTQAETNGVCNNPSLKPAAKALLCKPATI